MSTPTTNTSDALISESQIRLISDLTVELIECAGDGDLGVCAAAKVSTIGAIEADDKTTEAKSGLIRFLMKHRHGSPFEQNMMKFKIHVPIFVFREWHRHRIGWSYNEESGRYKKLDPVFYIPPPHRPIFCVDSWRPGRPKFTKIETNSEELRYEELKMALSRSYDLAYDSYEFNLTLNVDPGIARACLPVGIYSSMFATCNARSMMHFLSLRTHEPEAKFVSYPLWEIDQAARKLESIFAELFPITYAAFLEGGRAAP